MPTTTKYIWDEDNYLAEADGSDTINVVYNNEPQQYGNLVSARISNTTSYHHFDAIGSTRQLTNAAGHLTDKVIYDAWGNVVSRTGTTGVAMLWIGELEYYFDSEIATFYVRRRPYVAAIGRWTSVDPAGFVHGSNRLVYMKNRPTTMSDPSGLGGDDACASSKCDEDEGMVTTFTDPPPPGANCNDPCKKPAVEAHEATHRKNMGPCCAARNKCIENADTATQVKACVKGFMCWKLVNEIELEQLAHAESCWTATMLLLFPPYEDPFKLTKCDCRKVAQTVIDFACNRKDSNAKVSPCPFDKDGEIISDVAADVAKRCAELDLSQ